MTARAVCVELGGGGIQTVVVDRDGSVRYLGEAHEEPGVPLLIAVPGIIDGGRVVAASNLGWFDVDPVVELGLRGPALIVANDAEAAATGESVLRGGEDLAYIGLGTGIGGAIVRDDAVVATEVFGHRGGFSEAVCACGRTGCLETVAAGWALPAALDGADIDTVGTALARAIAEVDIPDLVVVAGGMARAYPAIIDGARARLPGRTIEGTRAPSGAKSAAAWGLMLMAGLDVRTPSRAAAPHEPIGR